MEAIELLMSRSSNPKLQEPGPDDASLERILNVAMRSPDHGLLRPWKVLLIRGESRIRLGEGLAEALKQRNPEATEAEIEKERAKPTRAPLVIAIAARLQPSPKVPEIEQVLSAGCLAYGLVLAAEAEGWGAIWRSGDSLYDRRVHDLLGLDSDTRLVAFVYVGTPSQDPPAIPRPEIASIVSEW